MRERSDWAPLIALAAAAVYFVLAWAWSGGRGMHPVDLYYYYYPNMLHAVQALTDDGRGLLWNAYQSCGQPFLGISSTGLLYPANAFFLLFDPDRALLLVTVFNLSVAGVSAYLLCRSLGLGPLAALGGGLAFAYGNASLHVTSWTPLVSSPYAWLPAIMLGCERILAAPSAKRGMWLAVVIAIALLPGFPQTVVFAYQLIALRALWELASRRLAQPLATLAALALGLFLPLLLVAVQLLPSLEMARLGVRGVGLNIEELGAGLGWHSVRSALRYRSYVGNPVALLPCALASCSLMRRTRRRVAAFYALSGLMYLALAFGTNTPLFALYMKLPLTNFFRLPPRFLWVTDLCVAVLTAFGIEALIPGRRATGSWRRAVLSGAVLLAAVVGLDRLFPGGLKPGEWAVVGVTVAAAVLANIAPAWRSVAGTGIAVALASSLLLFPLPGIGWMATRPLPLSRLLPAGEALAASTPTFTRLEARLTPNDRIYLVYASPGAGRGLSIVRLGPKVAGSFGVPSIHDYEPQPTRRYASYYTLMRTGRPMQSLGDYYLQFGGMMPAGFKRRLLDLAAARYLVVEEPFDATVRAQFPAASPVWEGDGLRVYENPQALPRAFWVPRVERIADPNELLSRLADGSDDLREVAFVEDPSLSGLPDSRSGHDDAHVEFVTNDPERIVLRVHAPARGFVHLSDQYFPGWSATVNGVPAQIMRANYLFRLVEVPEGESIVEFRYRPRSLLFGGSVSVLTAIGLLAAMRYGRRAARAGTRHVEPVAHSAEGGRDVRSGRHGE